MTMKRDTIKTLLARPKAGGEVTVMGWARAVRAQKQVLFIQVNDGSCLSNLQVVVPAGHPDFDRLSRLSQGAGLKVVGELAASAGSGAGLRSGGAGTGHLRRGRPDLLPAAEEAPHASSSCATIAHLRPRTNTFGAVLRVRNALARPSTTSSRSAASSTSTRRSSPAATARAPARCSGSPPSTWPIRPAAGRRGRLRARTSSAKPTYLTVSGQLEGEIFALALGNVYTFGPTFRAENSNTTRHLAEFWMVEPEMAFSDLPGQHGPGRRRS